MAKKVRKETFSEMLIGLKNQNTKAVPVEKIEERKYYLIVCEGTRTEPTYFEFLKQLLPKHLMETIQIIGQGENTVNVVKKAIEEKEKRLQDGINPAFDEVWAVFDKDDFPARQFNRAVQLAKNNGIESGHTNQAFELWYVLHFQFLHTALNRNDYFKILSKILGGKYKKNDPKTPQVIFEKGDVLKAIKWCYQLELKHEATTPANACPSTRLHILVERLLKYSEMKVPARSQ